MGTAKKAKYPIGFYICCITYTFERFAFYGTKPLLALFLAASVAEGGIGVTKALLPTNIIINIKLSIMLLNNEATNILTPDTTQATTNVYFSLNFLLK